MRQTLYANPLFATGLSSIVQNVFGGGDPYRAAQAELAASEAGLNNDTARYREAIGEAGARKDLAGILLSSLQAGQDFSSEAPTVASSLASLPEYGIAPQTQAQIQIGTGTQAASGTMPGLEMGLANRLDQVRMPLDYEERWRREGQAAFQGGLDKLLGVTDPAKAAFDRLSGAVGPLNITSGYRDPEHNAAVGGAKDSQHTHGNAFDIDVSGMPQEQRQDLIRQARAAGFAGIGVYDNALHFDVGGDRAWGPSYGRESLPAWAAEAVAAPLGQAGPSPVDMARVALGGQGNPMMTTAQQGVFGDLADIYLGQAFPDAGDPYTLSPGARRFGPDGSLIAENPATARGEASQPKPPTLSASGRAQLIGALGEDVDPAVAMQIVAQTEGLMIDQGMSENEALAYALGNQETETVVTDANDSWFDPRDWLRGPATKTRTTGVKAPPRADVGQPSLPQGYTAEAAMQEARDAIAKGADRVEVMMRLRKMGIDPAGL
ncbi:MAG: DUF882 domain-containing protein [Thauera sp.]|nr:DUF882 domain-containing protein [Thauera sp.]